MGPQGDTGTAGPQGDTGPMGLQGNTGPMGPQGDTGIAGPQGDTGLMGPHGATGLTGPQGSTGPIGPQGDTGLAGPTGPQGDTGPEGPSGSIGGSDTQMIYNNGGSAEGAEVYYINSTESVGIGTSSPSEKLHVEGNMQISGDGAETRIGTAGRLAIGVGATAPGNNPNVAIGNGATSNGSHSSGMTGPATVAIGHNAYAGPRYASAIGAYARASSPNYAATAYGSNARATGDGAISIGNQSAAGGWGGIAIGSHDGQINLGGANAGGWRALAIGTGTNVSANYSIGLGCDADVNAQYSAAFGYQAQITNSGHSYAFVFGRGTVAGSANQFIIGNASYPMNVGIGTNTPGTPLAVAGLSATSSYNYVRVDTATGDFYYDGSSERYKEKIEPLKASFQDILKAQPRSYTDTRSGQYEIGYVAEELDALNLENLVIYDAEGRPDGVKYDRISLYLLEIIKKQGDEIEKLKSKFAVLEQNF